MARLRTMDEIRRNLDALRQVLDEAHTMTHAGATDHETIGAALFGVIKLTEIVSEIADRLVEVE